MVMWMFETVWFVIWRTCCNEGAGTCDWVLNVRWLWGSCSGVMAVWRLV